MDNLIRDPFDRVAGRFHGIPCCGWPDSSAARLRSDLASVALRVRSENGMNASVATADPNSPYRMEKDGQR
jgi:hypothetical protein